MRKTAVQSNCSSSQPPLAGPMPTPMPATAAQMPIAFGRSSAGKTLVMIDRVVGMISAPPMPISALVTMSMFGRLCKRGRERRASEDGQPGRECTAAAEAIAERAHREQEAGEDEGVGVDDPLQLAAGRVEIALDCGKSDVEDRVVE